MQVLFRRCSVTLESFLGASLVVLSLTVINWLCHFKIALRDEIQAIYLADSFPIHLLPSLKINNLHVLHYFLNRVWSQVGENPEPSEKRYNLLKLTLLFLANRPHIILPMQRCKACLFDTLDSGGSPLIFQEGQLAETTAIWQPCHFLKPTDCYHALIVWIGKFEYLLMDNRLASRNSLVKSIQCFLFVEETMDIGWELIIWEEV